MFIIFDLMGESIANQVKHNTNELWACSACALHGDQSVLWMLVSGLLHGRKGARTITMASDGNILW